MLNKIKKIAIYLILFYAILGFFILPLILKPKVIDIVEEQTNSKLEIEDISFNPFTFKLEIDNLKLNSLDTKELVSLKNVYINLEPSSLLHSSIHIKDFRIVEPKISLVLDKDKKVNFASIVKENSQPQEDDNSSKAIPRIIIDNISIVDGSMDYEDYSRKSKFEFKLDTIGFELHDIDTKDLNTSDANVRFYSLLADGGFIDFKTKILSLEPLEVKGSLDFEASKLYTQWRYLRDSLNLEVADGKLSIHTDYYLNLDDLNATELSNLNIHLDKLRVKPKEEYKDVLNIKSVLLLDATIKPIAQDIHIEKIAFDGLDLKIKRDKNGDIDWLEHIKAVPDDSQIANQIETAVEEEQTKPWNLVIDKLILDKTKVDFNDAKFNAMLKLDSFGVDEITLSTPSKEQDIKAKVKKVAFMASEFSFEDYSLSKSVTNKINDINITVADIDSKEDTWMKYQVGAKINNNGKIESKGDIRHTPLKQEGSVEVDRISLKELTPYIQEYAHIDLNDGYVSLKTKTEYSQSSKKPDLSVNGSFKLEEVFINDSRDNTPLLSFNNINLKKFTLETSPNRFFVDNVYVDSFYVNAVIDENKVMNFATLTKVKSDSDSSVKDSSENEKFAIKIAKVNVANGSAHFSDLSLPIKFKTNIHDLNGEIYSISSLANETSYVDIAGEIDRYGSTKLKGGINASNPKAFTDLAFNFRNLDLSAMSGYSGEFAGYKIDNGKLFLNLNYDIKESQLLGENSIVIKNIELGDEIQNDTNSSLPLGFVIGLLEDSDGIIDIEMPVEGNVDEPDFKYGALILKTLVKLIVNAVTSPFSFLGSMLGLDGDKLGYVEFEGGSVKILAPEQEKLDNIAKLMLKRPKISLSVNGAYNEEIDKASMQQFKLINLVVKLTDAKNEQEGKNAMTIDLLEDIYEDARDDDKIKEIEDALEEKYDGDELQRAYLQALVKECSDIQEVSLDEIKNLAKQRATAIKSYLVDVKDVNESRIDIAETQEVSSDEIKLIKSKLEVTVK